MNNIYPIILCGGSGTRLWPLSREYYPKQFINFGSGTLFENTLSYLASLSNIQNPIIVCNEEHRFFVSKLLQQQNKVATIILESEGKNTAPAIALGVSAANELEDDPLILVLPSDHLIGSNSIFHSAVMSGISAAIEGYFVTFGVNPTGPESGFGYLQYGQEVSDGIFKILNFTEKPSKARAKEFLALGNYAWNSGIFLFRASTYLNELELLAPQIFSACKQGWDERTQDPLGFFRPNSQKFLQSPSGSIDYVIMEKTEKLYMVKLETNWSDLGSWESCYNAEAHDSMGNVVSGDVIAQDIENCYLNSTQRLVCALGVKNIIVVETADAEIKAAGVELAYEVGTMMEIPRACLTADDIATVADFFCFGTNDLTQMTYGFSRDDAGKFLDAYYDAKIFENDPFAKLDQTGVGKLMELAVDLGKKVRPEMHCGICGEHGGDPVSVEFCHKIGLDYVSCSPFRVPIARLAAAQAAIKENN